MAPKRSSSSVSTGPAPAAKRRSSAQTKLSFVATKPGAAPASKKAKLTRSVPDKREDELEVKTQKRDISEEEGKEETEEENRRKEEEREIRAREEEERRRKEAEEREREASRKTLDVDDPAYDRAYEEVKIKMGNAGKQPIKPIHAKDLNRIHHILRVFDLDMNYGPAVGLSRLQRWERAKNMGLDPPEEVKHILETREGIKKTEYAQPIFHGEV